MNWTKGQKAFYANDDERKGHHREGEVTVTRVGKVFVYAGDSRYYKDGGYGEYGFRLYESREAFEDIKRRNAAMVRIQCVGYRAPEWIPTDELERIAERLTTKGGA